jgi:hypothetical protein
VKGYSKFLFKPMTLKAEAVCSSKMLGIYIDVHMALQPKTNAGYLYHHENLISSKQQFLLLPFINIWSQLLLQFLFFSEHGNNLHVSSELLVISFIITDEHNPIHFYKNCHNSSNNYQTLCTMENL